MAAETGTAAPTTLSVVGAYDLHMHSTFSDGSKGVAELVRSSWEAGLAGIAVTELAASTPDVEAELVRLIDDVATEKGR